LKARELNHI